MDNCVQEIWNFHTDCPR